MMLLGLDLASRFTGWCAGDGGAVPGLGAWRFPAIDGDYGLLLEVLYQHLGAAHARWRFDAVAYESPILISGRNNPDRSDNLHTLRLLYPMGAFVEWWARREGIACYEVSVADVKIGLTGKQHATKEEMMAVVQHMGLSLPPLGADDAADAFAVWLSLLRDQSRGIATVWDSRVAIAQGGRLL